MMKFSLFVHMMRNDESVSHQELLSQLTELVEMAEDGGFEIAWIGEHHAMEFTIAPNPFICISYLADKTSKIRLGTGTIVAPFWHPIKLAGEAGLTDIITNGRLELGIARGAYQFEFDRLSSGMKGEEGGAYMREIVTAIKGLWGKDYAHDGNLWKFPATTPTPSPLQQPFPPISLAVRDIDSHKFAVENGCNVMVTPLWHGDDEIESLMNKFNTAVEEIKPHQKPKITLLNHSHICATKEQVATDAKRLSHFYATFCEWFKNERAVNGGFLQPIQEDELKNYPFLSPEIMQKNLLIDTPDGAINRLKKYEKMGYDEYSFWIDNGMSHQQKKESLSLFIKEVMPEFKEKK